jgi:hypothetical protein
LKAVRVVVSRRIKKIPRRFTLGSVLGISLILIGAQYFRPNHLDDTQLPGAAALAAVAHYGKCGTGRRY